ncbi:hypothetical protein C8R46DRAFT_1207942 [Mycena filopes]|nr:hypothetical protein C8R46DRAFT_1207942 [Mycena filopes]
MFSRLRSFFSDAYTLPPTDVRCFPCTGIDVSARDAILTTGLIINARLDAKKLEDTLTTLVTHKFPRAGARLALRNGAYEFRVPRTFDSTTPPLVFTTEDFAEPYRSATRPQLPPYITAMSTSQQPSVCPVLPAAFEVYLKSKTCPTSVEAFLAAPNTPLLRVHVALFDDTTFIGVTAGHILFDALGSRELIHAWTRLINGEDLAVIPGMDVAAAPLESFAKPNVVLEQRGWYTLGLVGQILFIVRFMFRIFRDPKEESRLVRVPKAFLEDSKREIMEGSKLQGSSEWVGSSDVLLAWWLKSTYGHRSPSDTTPIPVTLGRIYPIHVHLPVDLRSKPIFPGDVPLTAPYIHNAVSTIPIPIPTNALRTASLGSLALRIRRTILAYTADPAGIRADVCWRCADPLETPVPCPPRGEYTIQTNWRAARLGGLNFTGAVDSASESTGKELNLEGEGKRKVRVVLGLGYAVSSKGIPLRGARGIWMEDEDVVWMSQCLPLSPSTMVAPLTLQKAAINAIEDAKYLASPFPALPLADWNVSTPVNASPQDEHAPALEGPVDIGLKGLSSQSNAEHSNS